MYIFKESEGNCSYFSFQILGLTYDSTHQNRNRNKVNKNMSFCNMKEIVKYDSPQKFADIQRNLLQLEREAEIERTKDLLLTSESKQLSLKKTNELEKKGLGLKKLRVQEWTTSAFGRNLLTLAKYNQDDLPSSTISTGKSILTSFDSFRLFIHFWIIWII